MTRLMRLIALTAFAAVACGVVILAFYDPSAPTQTVEKPVSHAYTPR